MRGRVLAALALCGTGAGLLWASLSALRVSGPGFPAVPAGGTGPWHVGLVLAGLVLAALSLLFGARRSAALAGFLGVAAVLVSFVSEVGVGDRSGGDPGPERPAYSPSGPRPTETVVYARPAGEGLRLDVWEPEGGEESPAGRPAVVMVHGGGWHTGSRGGMPEWNGWFSDRDYVVFDVDYRLAPQPRWQAAPDDVKCAVGWVKRNAARYGVDPDRVAIVGYSAGGHLALLAAFSGDDGALPAGCGVVDPGVAAVAAFYPPTDLTRLHDMDWPWARPNVVGLHSTRGFLGGTPDALPHRFHLASPVNHVDPGDPPTLLVHGVGDRVVPFEQSRLLAGRLGEAGVPHRLLGVPGAGHSFDHETDLSWQQPETRTARRALSEFLRFSLNTQDGPRDDTPTEDG